MLVLAIETRDCDAAITRLFAAADAAMAHFVADYGLTRIRIVIVR